MTINRNNNGGDSRAIKVLMEQVSDLQEDLSQVQSDVNSLDNSKVGKDELAQSVETNELNAGSANIGSTTITSEQLASNKVSATDLYSPNADFEYEHANNGYIEDLTTDALTVNGDESVVNLNAKRVEVKDSLTAPNVISEDINATNVTATGRVSANNVATQTANVGTVNAATANITQNLNVNNLNITGEITGLNNVDIVANSIDTPTLDADEITTGGIVTSEVNRLTPSPQLDNNDTYTVELPVFTGTMYLSWKDTDENVIWTATVIGNGKDYSIHWRSINGEVTKLYQYNNHAYIKHNANGVLDYSYHATEELVAPSVWYNYSALDNVVPEVYVHDCQSVSGTVSFGLFDAPLFTGGSSGSGEGLIFSGSTTVENLGAPVLKGQLYNIINNGETNERFIEGAGKPINAGDDVVAVEVTIEPSLERIEGITELIRSSIATDDGAVLLFPQRENGISGNPTVQKIYKYDGNTLTDVDVTVADFWSYGFYSNPIKTPTGRIIVFNFGGNGMYGEPRSPIAIYSDDNGATWGVSYTTGDYTYVGVNLVSSATVTPDGTIYVVGNLGFQKSTDNGTTFARVVSEDENPIFPQMILALQDGSLLAVDDAPGGGKALYKSTNAGLNWTQIYTSGRIDYLYQFSNGLITIGPKYSTDNGETWQEINGQYPSFAPSFVELDDIIYSGNGLRSINGSVWESYVAIPDNYSWVAKLNDSTIVYSGAIYDEDTNHYFPAKYNVKPVKTLKWDKFAAGVNYDNFVADNIKATGNLEVDGASQFDDDVTVNADLSADNFTVNNITINNGATLNGFNVASIIFMSEDEYNNLGSKNPSSFYFTTPNGNLYLNGFGYSPNLLPPPFYKVYVNLFGMDRQLSIHYLSVNQPSVENNFINGSSIYGIKKDDVWNNTASIHVNTQGSTIITDASELFIFNASNMYIGCNNLTDTFITNPSLITNAPANYNPLEYCTNMSGTFRGCNSFNQPVTIPDNVTDLSSAFLGCSNFNQPITIGNSVTNLDSTFNNCRSFNQPITIPDNVTSMSRTFNNCNSFNQPITIPNNVIDMHYTFSGCKNFNQPITIPDSVTSMASTFSNCNNFNQPITIPDNVIDMYYTFSDCRSFNQPITIPDNVTSMPGTFYSCRNFNQPITIGNNVTNLDSTFINCSNFNQPIIIPDNVTSMSATFGSCSRFNQPITISDSVTNMSATLSFCYNFNQPITIGNSVTNLVGTFFNCRNLNQPITIPDSVTNMRNMFSGCETLNSSTVPIHISSSIDIGTTSNYIYNCLVNGDTGINWAGRILNDA